MDPDYDNYQEREANRQRAEQLDGIVNGILLLPILIGVFFLVHAGANKQRRLDEEYARIASVVEEHKKSLPNWNDTIAMLDAASGGRLKTLGGELKQVSSAERDSLCRIYTQYEALWAKHHAQEKSIRHMRDSMQRAAHRLNDAGVLKKIDKYARRQSKDGTIKKLLKKESECYVALAKSNDAGVRDSLMREINCMQAMRAEIRQDAVKNVNAYREKLIAEYYKNNEK